jgi:hypothetical protein
MSDWQDEARTLRHRSKALEDLIWQLNREPFAHDAGVLLQTFEETTYPTDRTRYFACHIVRAAGAEAEGADPELTTIESGPIYALNIGSKLPPPETYVIAYMTDGRWVFRYDGPEESA